MMNLPIVPHPCPICAHLHTRPWPACDTPACRHAWRNQQQAAAKRRRYEFYVTQGRCGDCGHKIAENERARNTGTKPIARCAACRAQQREETNAQRRRARTRQREIAAAERAANTAMRRRRANQQRVAQGLPPSSSSKPTPPPTTINQLDL